MVRDLRDRGEIFHAGRANRHRASVPEMTRFLLLVLVACRDDPGPPCDKVVDHMNEVMKQQMPAGHDGMQANSRKTDIQFCEDKKFSKQMRQCLLAAKDIAGIAECQKLR